MSGKYKRYTALTTQGGDSTDDAIRISDSKSVKVLEVFPIPIIVTPGIATPSGRDLCDQDIECTFSLRAPERANAYFCARGGFLGQPQVNSQLKLVVGGQGFDNRAFNQTYYPFVVCKISEEDRDKARKRRVE